MNTPENVLMMAIKTTCFNDKIAFTLSKADRVKHKKPLFNLVREQSYPTPGWKPPKV